MNLSEVMDIDCGDSITGVCICPNLSKYAKYVQFSVYLLYLNKAVQKKPQ